MKILVTGSTGLVGSALLPFLKSKRHEVFRLVRSQAKTGPAAIYWNPEKGIDDVARLKGMDAVVHLAGENIAEGRWTQEKKKRIRDSRVNSTRVLSGTLAQLMQPPRALLSASAIGYYGNRGDRVMREESAPGSDFLANVCREWEAATEPAVQKGIRVVTLRFGAILTPEGGALSKMIVPFQFGVGGKIGSGSQYMSWVALDDVIGAINHALVNESLRGPVNVVAPHAVTNYEFTKTLGRVLSRPTIFSVPAFAARLAFGEMADAVLLASTRVEPAKLKESGYVFQHPELESALRQMLKK
jgi:uncharacterized protein (TIGR01777 family)